MKKILFAVLMFLILPIFSFATEKKQAVYFYAEWCPHCQKVNEYFTEQGFYEKYDIRKLNFDEKDNQQLLRKIFAYKKYEGNAGIPAIVIDDKLLVGDQQIKEEFESTMESSDGSVNYFIEKVGGFSLDRKNDTRDAQTDVSMPVLISAALVDAINPCAFAVLILLVATVSKGQGRRNSLYAGLLFSLSVFISYFLMGLGLYKAITVFNIPLIISTIVGIVAVIVGLANLKDALWYGKGFLMEVPVTWRPRMQKILRSVTSPLGAFAAGFLVSLFLLPCSSGPYVVILGLLAERVEYARTISLLALYNLIFVLPMVLITLSMYFFKLKGSKLESLRKENLKLLHAIAGAIMIVMGIYLLKGWI
jgi:cytochrome c biogenesis protein CcdA/glutaredoxin